MTQPTHQETIASTMKGFSWNVAGNFIKAVAGFAVNIILARLLGPEPFGILALGLLIVGIGNLLVESGLGSALIQQESLDRSDIAFVFTIQMAVSITLAILFVVFAPWLAFQFSNPAAAPVLRVMAALLVIQAFALVPSALLRRAMNFKRVQLAQILSFAIGYIFIGLPLALTGFGVWSLVAAQGTQSLVNALILFFSARHTFTLSFKGSRGIALFGFRVLFANIANWIILYLDQAVVGSRFGAVNLGYYSRSYFLVTTPTTILQTSAQTSLFSAVSRMGKSPETLKLFRGFMSFFALLFFMVYTLIALESNQIIRVLYGVDWLPAAPLLAPLALAMPFRALVSLEGPILNGLGKPQLEMRAQWLTAVVAVAALITSSTISLQTIAWAILFIYTFRWLVVSLMTRGVLEVSFVTLLRPLVSGLVLAGAAWAGWAFVNVFLPAQWPGYAVSALRLVASIVVAGMVFLIGHKWLFPEIASFGQSLMGIFRQG